MNNSTTRTARQFFKCPDTAQASTVRIDVSQHGQNIAWAWHDITIGKFQMDVTSATKQNIQRAEIAAVLAALQSAYRPIQIRTANQNVVNTYKALTNSGQIARWQNSKQKSAKTQQKILHEDLWEKIAHETKTVQTEITHEPRSKARAAARTLGSWAAKGLASHALNTAATSTLISGVQRHTSSLVLHSDASYDPHTNIAALAVHNDSSNSTTVAVTKIASSYLAELEAVIYAARTAAETEAKHVVIHSDCLSAVNLIRHGKRGKKTGREKKALQELKKLQAKFQHFDIKWVKGHAAVPGNVEADLAARTAMRAAVSKTK
ncbi:MAG: reverse transcriptase-like protein [Ilumatobacter sp.]|nr:reverse transcriptase-like protein [Ilumatobacter sp.]